MNSTDVKPLVSIITIFLNADRFLNEAIESVFGQTYDYWELILVDDGSSDGSTEIVKRYAVEYPDKVFFLDHPSHQNRGMSASRNLGIRNAKGNYIAFLDADDVWLPEKLEQQMRIFGSQPRASMIYGRTLIWYSWTGRPQDTHRDHFYELGVQPDTLIMPPDLLVLLLQNKVQTPTTCNALLRRDVFQQIGGFQEEFRGMFEDQAFFIKVCLSLPVYVAGECWAKYRQHPDSCSAVAEKTGDNIAARIPLLNWTAQYLSEQGVNDMHVWKTLKKELRHCKYPLLHRLSITYYVLVWRVKSIPWRTFPAAIMQWVKR